MFAHTVRQSLLSHVLTRAHTCIHSFITQPVAALEAEVAQIKQTLLEQNIALDSVVAATEASAVTAEAPSSAAKIDTIEATAAAEQAEKQRLKEKAEHESWLAEQREVCVCVICISTHMTSAVFPSLFFLLSPIERILTTPAPDPRLTPRTEPTSYSRPKNCTTVCVPPPAPKRAALMYCITRARWQERKTWM